MGADGSDEESRTDLYWCDAARTSEEVAEEVFARQQKYYQRLGRVGIVDLWRRAHAMLYGISDQGEGHTTSQLMLYGDQDEKILAKSNQLRSIFRYQISAVTSDRPAWTPMAANNTGEAMRQVPLAKSILDYYMHEKRIERVLKSVAMRAKLYAKGYLWQHWDPGAGPRVQDQEAEPPAKGEQPKMRPSGDLYCKAMSPLDVISDLSRDASEHDWFIIRQRGRNRYDLIARYVPIAKAKPGRDPSKAGEELKDAILGIDPNPEREFVGPEIGRGFITDDDDLNDDVCVYHLYHERTEAVPEGRYLVCCDKDVILFDGPLPDSTLRDVVIEMVPEEFLEAGSVGYASIWDLMGLQDAYDSVLSVALTNFDAYATQNVLIPGSQELSAEEIRDGLNAIRYDPALGKPELLQLLSLPREFFELKDWIKSDMEVLSGANSVARGEPDESLKSGAALALVQAQALHFQSGEQAAYIQLLEDWATSTIHMLQNYASIPRLAMITDGQDMGAMREFVGGDVKHIDRIVCDVAPPITRTIGGKVDAADKLLDKGLVTNAQEYIQVRETGRLEAVTDPVRKRMQRIKEENDALSKAKQSDVIPKQNPDGSPKLGPDGQPIMTVRGIPALMVDDPHLHITEHAFDLGSLDALSDAERVAVLSAHIHDHVDVWRNTDPVLLRLLGFKTPEDLMPPPPPGMPPPPPGGPPKPPGPPEPPGPAADKAPAPGQRAAAAPGQQTGHGLPNMPTLPGSPLQGAGMGQ